MGYEINGVGVGHSPESFPRSTAYLDAFKRLGNSPDNIKVISNFLSESQCQNITSNSLKSMPNDGGGQWESMIYPVENLGWAEGINSIWQKKFDINSKMNNHPYMVAWTPGKSMPLHVDDLGSGREHIAAVVYLNEDYTGGEISFPTHGVSISPKTGDLVIFPGNLNYAHEVKPITSGVRYTIPVWGSILDN